LGLAVVLGVVAESGCASESAPVSRVQPNALRKSVFVRLGADGAYRDDSDSWYYRATVTDVPSSTSVMFVGASSEMFRIKWKIEERFLLAVREDPDLLGAGEEKGGVVAAFPILSHFDIRRDYNPNTGEELNVLVENTVDRPWWSRDYMRVDWSTNTLSTRGWSFPAIESISAATYFVQDPNDPDHPVFTDDYFDVTSRYTVVPDFGGCIYAYRDVNCGPADVSMRASFMKVPQREYVPREYPDRMPLTDDKGDPIRTSTGAPITLPLFDQYGMFRTERAVYDQRYGSLEKRFIYRANQWNLWQEWFRKDESGKVVHETGAGGEPDLKRPVLLPYSERKVRPIVYFLNAEWPLELRPTARKVAEQWNDAFAQAVASARLLEKKPGKAVPMGELRAEVDAMAARGERVFVLCENNPVKAGDPAECGAEGTVARIGDQRYSFMYWVDKNQLSGPLGYGPSYADPITGEIFSAGAYQYGAALDRYAQNGVEIVNLLLGNWGEIDYANGIAADQYAKRLAAGEVPGPIESAALVKPAAVPGERGFDLAALKQQVDTSIDRSLLGTIAQKGLPVATGGTSTDKLSAIKGTRLERVLFDNPELRALVGKTKDQPLTDDELHTIFDAVASPNAIKREQERLRYLGEHGCYFPAEFGDDAVIGIARELSEKYGKGETPEEDEAIQRKIWNDLRGRILLGLTQHEVGHTIGLRHNFEGSVDALNFHDEFWQLEGESPSYGAPLTEQQKLGKISEYQYSTVMDYGSRFNSDVHGLGKYDYAAIRFAYGDVVETWAPGTVVDPLYASPGSAFREPLFTGYSAEVLQKINSDYRHYTQIPKQFKSGTKDLKTAGRELRRFADVVENAKKAYLAQPGKAAIVKTGAGGDASLAIDVVPYRFCSDELANTTDHPLCQRWDTGIDSFEIVRDTLERYRQYYVFDAFTRGRTTGFTLANGYLSKLIQRYFLPVQMAYANWMFYQGERSRIWRDVLNAGGDAVAKGYVTDADWFKDPGGGLPGTVATYWGLDRLVDVLATPDVGVYQDYYSDGILRRVNSPYGCGSGPNPAACPSGPEALVLDVGSGARYQNTQYARGTGSSYFLRISNVGSIYDKIAALLAITYDGTVFRDVDQTRNQLDYRIGFYLAYPKAMTAVLGGIASEALDNYSWRWEWDGSKPRIMSPDVFATRGARDGVPELTAMKGKPIDSSWYFFYKGYALVFSMSSFRSSFAQGYNDAVRVWCSGCGEGFTPGAGTKVVSFVDPLSGKEYAAVDFTDRFGPGAAMIKEGQRLLKLLDEAKALPPEDTNRAVRINNVTQAIAGHVQVLDLVRGLYDTFGKNQF
jgi:hypothetical protein